MKLHERSYSTKLLRPRPVIHAEPDGSLLIITTAWGDAEPAQRVNDEIMKYVQAAVADVEVTSPFEFLTCLSDEANYLRVATMICNERLYRADNKAEFTTGLELLVLLRRGSHIAYAQVGAPHLMVQRPGQGLVPISVNYEAAAEMSSSKHPSGAMPPLPQALLGIDAHANIRSGDFRFDPADKLIVYAGSEWPAQLWSEPPTTDPTTQLQSITTKLVQKKPDSPFWLGVIALSE